MYKRDQHSCFYNKNISIVDFPYIKYILLHCTMYSTYQTMYRRYLYHANFYLNPFQTYLMLSQKYSSFYFINTFMCICIWALRQFRVFKF